MRFRFLKYASIFAAGVPLVGSAALVRTGCWTPTTPVCDGPSCFDVGDAWAGHPLTFSIATRGNYQVVAFYDSERRMILAERRVGKPFTRKITIPMKVNWDSHNGIAMAIDSSGFIHVASNMHASPMNYFSSRNPYDISSVKSTDMGIGLYLDRVTYPQFFEDTAGMLHLLFRYGKSGSGAYVMLSHRAGSPWSLVGGKPLLDFGTTASPYISGPYKDRQGVYHLGWIVRDTRDASSNHDIYYAKSKDLIRWTDSRGRPLNLPIRSGQGELVAAVPKGAGLLNGNVKMGFDRAGRPTFLFSRTGKDGSLDVYSSRLENGAWIVRKALDLHLRWQFQGGGSLENAMNIYSPELGQDGIMRASLVVNSKEMTCELRSGDAALVNCAHRANDVPAVLMQQVSTYPGMHVRTTLASYGGQRYLLRWETLAAARDQAVAAVPPASKLQLFDLNAWAGCRAIEDVPQHRP